MKSKLNYIAVTGIGIALFVVMTLCLQVPVFQNYYLCLGYIAMAVYCYAIGALSGTIVGVLGVVIYCLLTSGLRGMPGWALGKIVIGIALGLVSRYVKGIGRTWLRYLIWIVTAVCSTAAGILVVKSCIDSITRSQPFAARVVMNVYAFIADAFVLALSFPVCESIGRWLDDHIQIK